MIVGSGKAHTEPCKLIECSHYLKLLCFNGNKSRVIDIFNSFNSLLLQSLSLALSSKLPIGILLE